MWFRSLQALQAVLTYERDALRGRHALRHQQLEHGEGQQHRDAQRNLFPGVCGQVEAQRRQEGDHHAGDEQVEDVEGGAALQVQREGDVWVRIRAAAVQNHVLLGWHSQNLVQDRKGILDFGQRTSPSRWLSEPSSGNPALLLQFPQVPQETSLANTRTQRLGRFLVLEVWLTKAQSC